MLTIIRRSLLGALAGYAVYLVIAWPYIFIRYAMYGNAPFISFEVWVYPFAAPYLLSPQLWKEGHVDENLLILCGGLLMVAGAVWANWKTHH